MFSSTATTLRPTARSFAMFCALAPWMPAAAGSSLRCLLPRPEFTRPTVKNAVRSTVDVNFLARSLYLMCDDLPALMKSLKAKGVSCSPLEEED